MSTESLIKDADGREPEEAGTETPAGGPGGSGEESLDPIAALTAERDQLAAEKAELQDRLLRSQAEFQYSRKRAERERAEFAEYASTEAVRAQQPILDDV